MTKELLQQAFDAIQALRQWVKAVPDDAPLPTMPGVDGDWLDDVEQNIKQALAQQEQEAQQQCWCDQQGIGEPGVSCGDCPTRDYKQQEQPAQDLHPLPDSLYPGSKDWMAGYPRPCQ